MREVDEIAGEAAGLSIMDRLRLLRLLTASVESEILGQRLSHTIAIAPVDVPPTAQELAELTYAVIGCAMTVHRQLGPGLPEVNYQRGLEHQLTSNRILFTPQKVFEVYMNGPQRIFAGYYIADFLIERRLILEIKALNGLSNDHIAQTICYLAAFGCPVGLLINFGERKLNWRRVLPPRNIDNYRINRQWLYVPEGFTPQPIND